ncbi:MAG: ABC transporter ATP-binding protein/permease [Clostridiales bacterium]|nr:ABC transporter ATP-binding protein/permease [Clostridiales bacterium]
MGGPMGGGPMGGITVEKAKDFKGTVKKLIRYIGSYKLQVAVVIIAAALAAALMVYAPKILGNATTNLVEIVTEAVEKQAEPNLKPVKDILLTMIVIYIGSAVLSYVQGFVMTGVTMKISYKMRRDIAEKINKLPFKYFDATTHGEVLSRMTNDVDAVSQSLNQIVTQIITSVASVAGIIIMMLSISPPMTFAALAVMPVSLGLMLFVIKRSQKYFKNQFKHLGSVNGYIEEIFSGINVIKSFNAEKRCLGEFKDRNDSLYDVSWKANFYSGMVMPLMGLIGNIAYVVMCVLGSYFAAVGRGGIGGAPLTVGGIQSFIVYIRQFNQNVSQAANISNVLQQTAAAAERVFEFLEEEEECPDAETADAADVKNLRGTVDFQNVRFGYNENKIVIKNFSCKVEEGQKIAIVGPTGAGKTTIVKLLMRFYELNGGKILVGGRDIKEMNRNDLRSLFGMVLQDTWLFNGTVMENIRYGRSGADDGEVVSAAVTAHADRFIRSLPGGYNMPLNEEAANISQGQKQLLTIARAILADPKILILDEATSSVDTRTEILIQNAMDALMKNRTSFVIAHRLSTIKNADVILVLNDGDVIESGNHDELMKRGGFYSELYKSQFTQSGV